MTKQQSNSVTVSINDAINAGLNAERQGENAINKLSVAIVTLSKGNKSVSDRVTEYGKGTSKERAEVIIHDLCTEYVDLYTGALDIAENAEGQREKQDARHKVNAIKRMMQRACVIAALLIAGRDKEDKPFAAEASITKKGTIRVVDTDGEYDDYSASALMKKSARVLRGEQRKGPKAPKAQTANAGMSIVAAAAFLTSEVARINAEDVKLNKQTRQALEDLYIQLLALHGEESNSTVYKNAAA